jgi:hypothetical protein
MQETTKKFSFETLFGLSSLARSFVSLYKQRSANKGITTPKNPLGTEHLGADDLAVTAQERGL